MGLLVRRLFVRHGLTRPVGFVLRCSFCLNVNQSFWNCLFPWFLASFSSFCLQIMPPKRTKSASSVATPAKKRTCRAKSSQGPAVGVEQLQPQELSAEVLPQALLEQIVN